MKKTTVIVITTGGTIEKTYDESTGALLNRHSQLRSMLKKLRLPYIQIKQHELLYKDSLEMTDDDRRAIFETVKSYLGKKNPIIILHGTDTMEITAQYLYANLPRVKAPVILTGAMRPFGFEDSDATQNFTGALMAAIIANPGIYISMHNALHPLPGVRKNRDKGTFEPVE